MVFYSVISFAWKVFFVVVQNGFPLNNEFWLKYPSIGMQCFAQFVLVLFAFILGGCMLGCHKDGPDCPSEC